MKLTPFRVWVVHKILADFVEYRKHPNKKRDTFNYTIFVTNYDVPNEDVVQRVAKEFKDAGYYVWVERSSRFGNGRLAVTERPKGPNTGNNYRMV